MAWQSAEPGSIAQDAQGNYHIKTAGGWVPAPKGSLAQDASGSYHFNTDMIPASPPSETKPADTKAGMIADAQKTPFEGISDLADFAVKNFPHETAAAIEDAVRRSWSLIGADTHPGTTPIADKLIPHAPLGQAGQNFVSDVANSGPVQAIHSGVQAASNAIGPTASDAVSQALHLGGDVLGALPAVGAGRAVLRGAGDLFEGLGAGAGLNEMGMAPQEQIVARRLANDKTVTQAATQRNQQIGNAIAGRVIGTNLGDAEAPSRVIAARAPANSVYDRMGAQLPTQPLENDQQLVDAINAAGQGGSKTRGTPASQQAIAAMRAQLLDGQPTDGPTLVQTQRSLRNDGRAGLNSTDPDAQHLGQAKIDIANALDGYFERNLPANAEVSQEQLAQARTALAQSHTVQDLLTPSGNIDLHALAKLHLDNPQMLTGPLRDLANFAGENPLVTRAADSILPADAIKDLRGSISPIHPLGAVMNGFGGAALARRILGAGRTAEDVAATNPLPPQPIGGAGTFDPIHPLSRGLAPTPGQVGPPVQRQIEAPLRDLTNQPPRPGLDLEPPPGTAFEPNQPALATGAPTQRSFFGTGANAFTAETPRAAAPAPRGGDIPLADVLSHGVEQEPAPGLSLAPDYVPSQGGIPFRIDPAHMAGDLQLADALTGRAPENLSDVAGVRSQGVPDGTLQRAPAKFKQNKRDLVDMNLSDLLGGK